MQSVQPSRGRILFEVLCAFALAASFAGAWMQLGASALLGAASVSALYGLVHFFDLFRRNPAVAVEPQRVELPSEVQTDFPAFQEADALMVVAGHELTSDAAPEAKPDRPVKAARKKKAKATEPAPVVEVQAVEPAPPEEAEPAEFAPAEEPEAAEAEQFDEVAHISHAPLFEPAPFVRQHRTAFGRKAG